MVSALPSWFLWLVGLIGPGYIPAWLHGSGGGGSGGGLWQATGCFSHWYCRPCRPWKVSTANALAVLSLLDAPNGCDPAYYVFFGRRFRQMRRYLGYRPGEVHGVYRLLDWLLLAWAAMMMKVIKKKSEPCIDDHEFKSRNWKQWEKRQSADLIFCGL